METSKSLRRIMRACVGRVGVTPALMLLMSALFILAPVSSVQAIGRIDIGAGSTLNIPGGSLHMGCGNFNVLNEGSAAIGAGVLDQVVDVLVENTGALVMLTGLLEFSGMWTVPGSFDPGTGTVAVVDDCGSGIAIVNGSNVFCNFKVTSDTGQLNKFEVGTTQLVLCHFEATGVKGQPTLLRSTSVGKAAYICLGPNGTQYVQSIDVADVQVPDTDYCQRLAPGDPSDYDSVDSGNTFGWFNNGINVPVPTIDQVGAAMMVMAMLLLGWHAIKREKPIV